MTRRQQGDSERIDLLQQALAMGLTSLDTAPLYEFGRIERQVGKAIEGFPRDELQILGKVGLCWHDDHGDVLFRARTDQGQLTVRKDSRPESILQDVDASLERPGIECLDLVQIHHPDRHTPIDESIGALLDLKNQGKVENIGISNFSLSELSAASQALGDVPLFSTQNEYSLVRRQVEHDLLPYCQSHDIALLAYSPLAGGLLSGRIERETKQIKTAFTETLLPMAAEYDVSPATLAIAWLLQSQGVWPIGGISTREQLHDQAAALNLAIDTDDANRLSRAFEQAHLVYEWERESKLRRLVNRVKQAFKPGVAG